MGVNGEGETRHAGSLQPAELAHAAVMAALSAATAIIAVVVPFAAGLSVLGTVPMGLLAYRYRLRVLIAATVAGGVIAFLIAGMGGFMTVVNCAYVGGLTGIVKRRGRGAPTAFVAGVLAGVVFGLLGTGALMILARLRNLVFDSMTANINGLAAILNRIPGLEPVAARLKSDFATILDYWPVLIIGSSVLSITMVTMIGWWALSRVLSRLLGVPDVHKLDVTDGTGPVAPVPARLRDVTFRYPGSHPRLARPGVAGRRGRRARRDHRGQRLGQDDADAAARGPRTDVGHHRTPGCGRPRPGRWHRGRHAAPRESGPRHARGRRRRVGAAAGRRDRRAPAARPRSASTGWPNATPAVCPAANCSGWPSLPRWRASPPC